LYRWTVYNSNSDPLGPAALAESMQDNIDGTVADFVPFITTTNSDGLEVYRSHFTQSGKAGNNGPASPTETLTNGNSLGGGTEAGGDEGGVILGHDFGTVNTAKGTGTGAGKCKVSWKTGRKFGFPATTATAWVGTNVDVNGVSCTVAASPAPTATTLYCTPTCGTQTLVPYTHYTAPTAPGTLNKKQ
jgi:hypothetical protein